MNDLNMYRSVFRKPVISQYSNNLLMFGSGLPMSGGICTAQVYQMLDSLNAGNFNVGSAPPRLPDATNKVKDRMTKFSKKPATKRASGVPPSHARKIKSKKSMFYKRLLSTE